MVPVRLIESLQGLSVKAMYKVNKGSRYNILVIKIKLLK